MKKILSAVFAAVICLSLFACGRNDGGAGQPGNSEPSAALSDSADGDSSDDAGESAGAEASSSMREIADAVAATGLFGDSMELHVKGDEYAADILEFTYGISAEEHHIADYVVSEQTSKQAYSFAYIVFGDGYEAADSEAVSAAISDVYLEGLRSALEAYNPEAYAMCDGAAPVVWQRSEQADGAQKLTHGVYLIISDSNSEAAKKILPAHTEIVGG